MGLTMVNHCDTCKSWICETCKHTIGFAKMVSPPFCLICIPQPGPSASPDTKPRDGRPREEPRVFTWRATSRSSSEQLSRSSFI